MAAALLVGAAAVAAIPQRQLIDADWRFLLAGASARTPTGPCVDPECQSGFDDSAWRALNLPHDFVVEGNFTPSGNMSHGYLPFNKGWYRKHITIPADWKGAQVWIEVDAAQTQSTVYLNGDLLTVHNSGYTSYHVNLGDANATVNWGGNNVFALFVDATHPDSWWYDGGGLYRHVYLSARPNVHIEPWGVYAPAMVDTKSIRAGTGKGLVGSATLNVSTEVHNRLGSSTDVTVTSTVLLNGKEVATKQTSGPAAAGITAFVTTFAMDGASLWSVESPTLYTLRTVVKSSAGADTEETTFGIRSVVFNANQGLLLNGVPTKVQGMCNHQDFAGTGVAVPDSLEAYRVWRLKQMGTNAWRTSHNPPNKELLDECDRQGMMVWDENHRNRNTGQYVDDLRSMVRRDRNHPSIILWSICNEALCDGFDTAVAKTLKPIFKEVDPYGQRPVTAAMNGGYSGSFPAVLDVMGFNYNIGQYDGWHKKHPDQPIIGSETSSDYSDRSIYANDKTKSYVSAYDVNWPGWGASAEEAWVNIAQRDFIAGGFTWTGFDYKGEPTPYAWPNVNSHFGVIDIAGFPKDNYYYYQSVWKTDRMVHVFPHWNWDSTECKGACTELMSGAKQVDVWAYANADTVELFVNGKSQGNQTMPFVKSPMGRVATRHVSWKVDYAPGTIMTKAYVNGSLSAQDTVETTGSAVALRLSTEWPLKGQLKADGVDVALVTVELVDAKGRMVPTASAALSFSLEGAGRIIGLGNGDPDCHEHDRPASTTHGSRSAWNGLARAVLQSASTAGTIKLSVSAGGLTGASITIPVA
eukprot:TRINITY_DN2_c0_g1_i3.p1 TRINITY_DN2_c0_g1~~TRINITY_DN2_c0_g1_i3.p1  ORF type:complete len:808 (+),score=252.48 TRINITY_DN2_c0_g1_i3:52-2475(+)